MSQRLTIQSHLWKHDLLRIDIRGALVSETVPILDGEFATRFQEGHESFVLMLNQLTEISLAGGAALVGQLRVAQERAGSVTLVQPSPEVEQVFGILGVLPLLHIVRDTAELIGAGKARHHDAKPDAAKGDGESEGETNEVGETEASAEDADSAEVAGNDDDRTPPVAQDAPHAEHASPLPPPLPANAPVGDDRSPPPSEGPPVFPPPGHAARRRRATPPGRPLAFPPPPPGGTGPSAS